jgi:hypothetical protein
MATIRSLESRIDFTTGAVRLSHEMALRSAMFQVFDNDKKVHRTLKLWRKTGGPSDRDVRELWRHEMRQLERLMLYSGAAEVIVNIVEFIEDDQDFGVVLDLAGQPLSHKLSNVTRDHWLRSLNGGRSRTLLWRNIRRLALALGIVHAQGMIHGAVCAEEVITEGAQEPDFQLGGFEWSLRVTPDDKAPGLANLTDRMTSVPSRTYSFEQDWRDLGLLAASLLAVEIDPSGNPTSLLPQGDALNMTAAELSLLRTLIHPTRRDAPDAGSTLKSIDDVLAAVSEFNAVRPGKLLLTFQRISLAADIVTQITEGEIEADDHPGQMDWLQAEIESGATLSMSADFGPTSGHMLLVTSELSYHLFPFTEAGGESSWDIAVCRKLEIRSATTWVSLGTNTHVITQPISILTSRNEAQSIRNASPQSALDWSAFSRVAETRSHGGDSTVRHALNLVEVIGAVVKALDILPITLVDQYVRGSSRFASFRAYPGPMRDNMARKVRLEDTSEMLRRLFEDDARDENTQWWISQNRDIGGGRDRDVSASFVGLVDDASVKTYLFEVEDTVPVNCDLYLRPGAGSGTTSSIHRRLSNISAIETRPDLADFFQNAWKQRKTANRALNEEDAFFKDLDSSKQKVLQDIWTVLPAYFVVGPPGVGKTYLAAEVVRRRLSEDGSTRMLLTAQGHDALDVLESDVREVLARSGLNDPLVVRSIHVDRATKRGSQQFQAERLAKIRQSVSPLLQDLSKSILLQQAPPPLRDRVMNLALAAAGGTAAQSEGNEADFDAVQNLLLDSANVLISTTNSPDIGRLVEDRDQFDLVLVEEAGKATGPELSGALALSGRRLLIGDHKQLPPFDSDKYVEILASDELTKELCEMAGELVRNGRRACRKRVQER